MDTGGDLPVTSEYIEHIEHIEDRVVLRVERDEDFQDRQG